MLTFIYVFIVSDMLIYKPKRLEIEYFTFGDHVLLNLLKDFAKNCDAFAKDLAGFEHDDDLDVFRTISKCCSEKSEINDRFKFIF